MRLYNPRITNEGRHFLSAGQLILPLTNVIFAQNFETFYIGELSEIYTLQKIYHVKIRSTTLFRAVNVKF